MAKGVPEMRGRWVRILKLVPISLKVANAYVGVVKEGERLRGSRSSAGRSHGREGEGVSESADDGWISGVSPSRLPGA